MSLLACEARAERGDLNTSFPTFLVTVTRDSRRGSLSHLHTQRRGEYQADTKVHHMTLYDALSHYMTLSDTI